MKLNLFNIFSELVTGLAFISIALIYGCFSNNFDIATIINFIKTNFSFSKLLGTSILVYYIGFIIDGIGLGIGDLFLDKLLLGKQKIKKNRKRFFREVPQHVFEYRNRQWAYYSCYRNLLLLTTPLLIITVYYTFKLHGIWIGLGSLAFILLVIQLPIFKTAKMLLKLYYSIEESFE